MILAPLIPLTLDRLRHLMLDIPALERAEARLTELSGHDVSIFDVLSPQSRLRLRNLRILLWAAFVHEDPRLTDEEVGSWLNFGNMSDAIHALDLCIQASLPKREEVRANGQQEQTPLDPQAGVSIGSDSGPLDESSLVSNVTNGAA